MPTKPCDGLELTLSLAADHQGVTAPAGITALRTILRASAAPLIAAVAAQSAGNLVFHAAVGRLLPADDYGALGAVLAAMVMLGIPLGALQTSASALTAADGVTTATLTRTIATVGRWAALAGGGVLLATPVVRDYFRLESSMDAALLAPYLVVTAVLATARGLLLGARRITAVAATYLAGTVVRVGLGLGLVYGLGVDHGVGVRSALAATLIGEVAALVIALGCLIRTATAAPTATPLRLGTVGRAAAAVTGLFLFSTVDLLLARHHLRGAASGGYIAAATVAKTVLALPAAIMSAVFPRLVAAWSGPTSGPTSGARSARRRAVALGAGIVVGPATLGAIVVIIAPGELLRLLYGDGYASAAALVQALAGIAAATSLVTFATYAALARRAATLWLPWFGALFEVVLIELRHGSAMQIAVGSATALLPTLAVIAVVEGRAWMAGGRAWPHWSARTAQFATGHADRDNDTTGQPPVR